MQSFSQILVISGLNEGNGEDGQAWDFRPASLHKALYTQQWHLHALDKSTTKMETDFFNVFLSYMLLSLPIRGGQSTERKAGESIHGWLFPIKISLPVTAEMSAEITHPAGERSWDEQRWRELHFIMQQHHLNWTGSCVWKMHSLTSKSD